MQKKVLQDIHTPQSGLSKDLPTRKWDYGGGDLGITKKNELAEEGGGTVFSQETDPVPVRTEVEEQPETYKTSYYNGYSGDTGGGVVGRQRESSKFPRKWFVLGGILIVLAVAFFAWSFFSTATVKVVLSQQTKTINDTFAAVQVTDENGGVPYQIVKLQESATFDVEPTGEENAERKASGEIIVSNTAEESVKLIVNTRFQSPDGKIYRIDKAIVIPAAKKDASGNLQPGMSEVTVYADEAGDTYNTGMTDFTVPGLMDTDLYDKVSARSKTEMTGGFKGILKYASDEDIASASASLQEQVRTKLLNAVQGSIGEERVLYTDAVFIEFKTNVPTEVSANGMLTIEEVGLLQAFVFDRKVLSGAIAQKSLSSYDKSAVIVRNLDELGFIFEDKENFEIGVSEGFKFALSGDPHIVWEVDTEALKADLTGISEDEISSIIKKYSSIRRIEADIKPFWKRSFPSKPESITIEEVLE